MLQHATILSTFPDVCGLADLQKHSAPYGSLEVKSDDDEI